MTRRKWMGLGAALILLVGISILILVLPPRRDARMSRKLPNGITLTLLGTTHHATNHIFWERGYRDRILHKILPAKGIQIGSVRMNSPKPHQWRALHPTNIILYWRVVGPPPRQQITLAGYNVEILDELGQRPSGLQAHPLTSSSDLIFNPSNYLAKQFISNFPAEGKKLIIRLREAVPPGGDYLRFSRKVVAEFELENPFHKAPLVK